MEICRYLAMTRWEMENFPVPQGFFPALLPWEPNLADLPERLPEETVLVLHDGFPIESPGPILEAVEKTGCSGVLLDFQKPGQEAILKALVRELPHPIAVSEPYAREVGGAVFLPPCPPDRPLETHLAPWKDRQIWLDTAPEVLELTLTETGCTAKTLPSPPNSPHFTHETLNCRYKIETFPNKLTFTLWRDKQMLEAHMEQAQALGVTKTFTLFQEWRMLP